MALRDSDPLALDEPAGGGQDHPGGWEEETEVRQPSSKVPFKVLRGHGEAVTSCHLCFDDSRLLTSSHDNTAIIWDTDRLVALQCYGGSHSAGISECALVPGTNRMVTVSWDQTMVCWDLETAKTLWTSRHAGLLTSCSVSSDGKLIVCVSDMDNEVDISLATNGECLHKVKEHHSSTMTRCRFDPQGQHVATVSVDRTIKLWDLLAQRTTMSINSNHSNTVSSCCFTDSGRFLCTASWDRSLQLWDLETGTFRSRGGLRLEGVHVGSVSSCVFSADAQLLVSGSYDRTVALWDMASQCHTLSLKGHSDWVTDVSISMDKKLVASCSRDGTCRLWSVEACDVIPEVVGKTENQLLKCGQCGGSFCVPRSEASDQLPTNCVFCRMKTGGRYRPQPPSL
ncbi:WD repeat-containing protein 88-like isoform X1 [Gadus macrocephalus]|uniref:WD repeat-containing protein 88-like isoform X1 n=1 Tax=Gadus macrocephalus TaxID=80720 RepID=UPI0028CBC0A3|nr:WD repeat-containing protein 88-like isoform X1 [Gadus macrocephalus]